LAGQQQQQQQRHSRSTAVWLVYCDVQLQQHRLVLV
jgi:hypothetical protein